MANLYLLLLVTITAIMLVKVAWNPRLIFEYPYFMAAIFAVFILPQAYSLLRFPGGVSQSDIADVMLMSVLCLSCAVMGYWLKPSDAVVKRFSVQVDPERMLHAGVILIIIAASATYSLRFADIQFTEKGGLTGAATIYIFFVGLGIPGLAICLQLLRDKFTFARLVAVVLGSIGPINAVIHGRRETAAAFVLTIALTGYFKHGKAPARALIFAGLFFAMVAIPATGAYRSLVYQGEMRRVKDLNVIGNFQEFVNSGSILELRNGAALMRSTKARGSYGLGRGYWDQIVFRFVPAQWFGRDFKDSLMLGSDSKALVAKDLANTFEMSVGSTVTGMGDSFLEFGWFGCLFFAALALFFKSVWEASIRPNARFAQVVYIMICGSAMRTVTHQTVDFLPGFIYQVIFLYAAYWYAGIPEPRMQPQARPQIARRRGHRY